MAYLDRTQDPRRRNIAIIGVAAIHALMAYVVIHGLAVHLFPPAPPPPLAGPNIPLPPPPPPPKPHPRQTQTPKGPTVTPQPVPQPTPVPTFVPLPLPPTGGVDTNPQPTPSPTPSVNFTPRGTRPHGDPSNWVVTDDYPPRDQREGNEGTAVFRVTVGSDGRVTGCQITRSSGYAGLDDATCRYISRRASFDPATDSNGQKVAGSWSSSVRWQLPG